MIAPTPQNMTFGRFRCGSRTSSANGARLIHPSYDHQTASNAAPSPIKSEWLSLLGTVVVDTFESDAAPETMGNTTIKKINSDFAETVKTCTPPAPRVLTQLTAARMTINAQAAISCCR